MIHLDANYLILGNRPGSPEDIALNHWLASGQQLAASSIAWMEFVSGPVPAPAVAAIRLTLGAGYILAGLSLLPEARANTLRQEAAT